MDRAVNILLGILAGLFVGLLTIGLGTLGSIPPDAPDRCIGLIIALLLVGGLCGGWVSWRLGRERLQESRRLRQRR